MQIRARIARRARRERKCIKEIRSLLFHGEKAHRAKVA